MTDRSSPTTTSKTAVRAVRFHTYGEPADVLHLETVPLPVPGPGRIRIVVHACGIAPADWALCRGLFAGELPRGIGIDVSGTVDMVGDGVTDVRAGDLVFGNADWRNSPFAGASDQAIMDRWVRVPTGLDLQAAAALPMAVETAWRHLSLLGLDAEKTILIHGAGTTIGYAAVQMALMRGMRVVGTAGRTYAGRLRDLGALVTSYGDGMVERVRTASNGPVDLVFDASPATGALPDLVEIAGGDPERVLTVSDFAAAEALGVRTIFSEQPPSEQPGVPIDPLPEFAQHAADGTFSIPIGATFALEDWKAALDLSLSGQAHGKLLLIP